jgi:hypothetical protein
MCEQAHSPDFMNSANGPSTMSRLTVNWLLSHPKPTSGWGASVAIIHDTIAEVGAWREAVTPMAHATKLSYTQTWCSYRGSQAESIPGWRKLAAISDPEDGPCENRGTTIGACEVIDPVTGARRGGMHAMAFVSDDGGRVIIAFRGTDLDPRRVSGRARPCAVINIV